ncbi:zinc/manganese transport system permease protein [Streptomyces sp. 1114.5]|uniref:metal ABC transporter permease n=1 Tax=unclassified Streptomyces TaxID=2593676 RepID=UPI000BCFAD37|nr:MULTISPECIES: metal ABC transporter permease [unclassified Streptomyces]RKT19458.1 zinc/manganese transport system permease protein [Streptomyces sp. 1114.5]SOB85654.1 zinc/manganese transport system permease protein [Streptomyces sp. 1331.2]
MTSVLHQAFFQHALLAGTAIALASGLVGYFLVLRAQTFTGDTLSHVAFTGAMAALAGGYDLRLGLFAATIGVALLLGLLGRRGRPDDVVIGTLFSWILGLGTFFLTLYTTHRSTTQGNAGISVLFGSIYGLSGAQTAMAVLVAVAVSAAALLIARPLLFATLDEAVATARGVRTGALGLGFLALVGACAAEATQAVGSLLLLGLLAAPAGTALRLTDRPYRALALSAALAVLELWAGLALSAAAPRLPPSFAIMAIAAACYGASALVRPAVRRATRRATA